ncbi:hypothetical protein KUA12_03375 [Komagataeibacter oboediens]|nr:Gfo/Idh/MocA family oxidoreductase [Komagataeibacter oboediens]MBV1823071.1 hypothetical protein [Komagataeibacter oboediens]
MPSTCNIRAIPTNGGNQGRWPAAGHCLVSVFTASTRRALLGEEPVELFATQWSQVDDLRFREVEASVAFTLKFPSGAIATCSTSYAAHERRDFRGYGTEAAAGIENAFAYEGQRLSIARRDGPAELVSVVSLPQRRQFAIEIDHFAQCVRSRQRPCMPGEEGLQDQILMAALYESARLHKPIILPTRNDRDAFRGPMPKAGAWHHRCCSCLPRAEPTDTRMQEWAKRCPSNMFSVEPTGGFAGFPLFIFAAKQRMVSCIPCRTFCMRT